MPKICVGRQGLVVGDWWIGGRLPLGHPIINSLAVRKPGEKYDIGKITFISTSKEKKRIILLGVKIQLALVLERVVELVFQLECSGKD